MVPTCLDGLDLSRPEKARAVPRLRPLAGLAGAASQLGTLAGEARAAPLASATIELLGRLAPPRPSVANRVPTAKVVGGTIVHLGGLAPPRATSSASLSDEMGTRTRLGRCAMMKTVGDREKMAANADLALPPTHM